jgi:hypothetical protein
MNKKIVFFEPYSLASPHFETALELIQDHRDLGDKLFIYQCNAGLYFCDSNPSHDLQTCLRCIGKGRNGLKRITGKPVSRHSFLYLTEKELYYINNFYHEFKDIDELKAFTFNEIDIGLGSASSLITILKDPRPDTIKHRDLIVKIIKSSLAVYFSFDKYTSSIQPDAVYVFNGRFAIMRVVLRLCQRKKIEIRIHDRGSSMYKYNIFYDSLPHDMDSFRERVITHWENYRPLSERESQASLFYEQRRGGVDQALPSFSKGQTDVSLPSSWNPNKRNIVIFNSTEDEFASIGPEFHHHPFTDQLEALEFIREWAADKHDIDIYLRMHPRLEKISNNSVTDLYKLDFSNFHIIRPESPCSTYSLIDHCDAVLTFGSRAGIEATFWGKPSILIGSAIYESFDVVHRVASKKELINAILRCAETKPKERTLPFGLYMVSHGTTYKYYQPDSFFSGKYRGRNISSDSISLKLSRARLTKKIFWPMFKLWNKYIQLPSNFSTFRAKRPNPRST